MVIYLMWMKLKTKEVPLGRAPVGSIVGDRESILLASSAIVCYIIDVIKISKEAI